MIFAAAVIIAAGLFIGLGILKGRKYVWIFTALKIASLIISAVLSVILSTVIARSVIQFVFNKLVSSGKLGDVGDILADIPSVSQAVSALVAMIIAPFLFWILFALLKKILYFVSKLVSRSLIKIPALAPVHKDEEEFRAMSKRKQKKLALRTYGSNPIGMLLGGVLGLLLFFVVMVPILGTVGVANDVVATVAVMNDDKGIDMAGEIIDAADENFASSAVRTLGAQAVYDQLTTYKVGVGRATLSKEVNFVMVTGKAVYAFSEQQMSRTEAAAAVREVGNAFADSMIVPTIAPEFLAAAGDDWSNGRSFNGIKKPSLKGIDGLTDALIETFADSDVATVRADVKTLANVVASVVEHDAASKFKTNVISVFEDTELSYEIIYELLSSEHLAPLVGEITEVGFDMLGSGMNAEFEGLDLDSSNIQDKETEAHELADVLSHVADLLEKKNSQGFDAFDMAREIGPMLDEIDHTELIGHENTAIVLKGVFLSPSVYGKIGFSESEAGSVADSINEKAEIRGYTPLITAVMDTVDVIKMTSDGKANGKEMVEKIETLLNDLTPESAELLGEMTTPGVIESRGVAPQTAEPMSNMMSAMFSDLSDAKENGMSEEQYNKEAKAMRDMMSVGMNFNKTNTSSVFGEGSATGVEADEFVDNMFDSTVISSTVVDTVYADGDEAAHDPLKFGNEMGETDKAATLGALNNKWASATDEQKSDTEYQKKYIAIGSVMNMAITITPDGIVG